MSQDYPNDVDQYFGDEVDMNKVKIRPVYETDKTKKAEREFCDNLAGAWGVTMIEMAPQYHIDRLLFRGEPDAVAALEVKCLNKTSTKCAQYGDIFLNLEKHTAMMAYAGLGLPSIFAVRLIDGDFFCRLSHTDKLAVRHTGRTDRGDILDIKPVVRILWERFRPL
jgi:hypothetical protein